MLRCASLLVLIVAGSLIACKNSNYCADRENHDCRIAAIDSGTTKCGSDSACTDPKAPVCDLAGSQTCVLCTADHHDACMGDTPVCGDDHTCRGCSAHTECAASMACLPDGTCGSDDNVAYVAAAPAGRDNAACTMQQPCLKLSAALAMNKPFVKLQGTVDEAISINNQSVTLIADPGAQLTSSKNGLLLEIKGSSQVAIYDLEITGASGPPGVGISLPPGNNATLELHRVRVTNNNAGGITANGGTLAISQSTISGNPGGGVAASASTLNVSQSTISGNTAGGISVTSGTFTIVGNVFFNNGSNTSLFGGISAGITGNSKNRLDFNTFALNTSQDGVGPAIHCVGMFTASNNILSNNRSVTKTEQVDGSCSHTYSIANPGPALPGMGNSAVDPLFVDLARGDIHLQPTSSARRAADPQADLTGLAAHDIDGDLRVAPADIGADQAK